MTCRFIFDERLGIPVPEFDKEWEEYSLRERESILFQWEQIRGTIPDRIKQLEGQIIAKQNKLNVEDDFPASCALNSQIADLASAINDLHLWFRTNQEVEGKIHG
ncbi:MULTISPECIES: hypothetical protein [unclassified Paenibacillus]|uniref:hypothetical protein n=1 Tax=unclassified Paenibacillus TaxID=185978 RepID=UPI00020D7F5E|nr:MULTISPECIES: hypothetical protein [unclassified Paenibacillus]EGL16580.1 hypothetical protein HMPREF9413_5842 [Paenibacillus sp. HGF7]EPD82378.1 hypothetical protein HMPREF1207_04205 [Paenibacillus sp. HGH0039]